LNLSGELVRSIVKLLGSERVFTERSDLIAYCSDYSRMTSYEEFGAWPLCAVLPESAQEVSEIVKLAVDHQTPIVPRGGGSSGVGGVIPSNGSIVLSTSRMDKVIEVDPVNLTVTAQAGVNLKRMDEILEPHGLILAQEQGSYKVANIGGAVSTNGFSLRHNRYRNIGDNVLSMEVVIGDGRILRTGRKVCSNSSGYPLHKIFVGAEGTLGIITELTLRVMPKPEVEVALAASFGSWEDAEKTAIRIMQRSVGYSGGYCVGSVSPELGTDEMVGMIILGVEGDREETATTRRLLESMLREAGGKLLDEKQSFEIWRHHRLLWCGTAREDFAIDDLVAAMPLQHYDEAFARIEREIFPKYGMRTNDAEKRVITIGSRALVAFNFTFDEKKLSLADKQKAMGEMMKLVAEYGGAGPGCHAVGLLLRDHFGIEHDPVRFAVMREVKKLFDPHNIMNPGKKFIA
jgi:glycolate oxidase